MKRRVLTFLILVTLLVPAGMGISLGPPLKLAPAGMGDQLKLPVESNSVRFMVIGDMGNGKARQYDLAKRMDEARQTFPFTFAITLGDNLYGDTAPEDFQKKFEIPYKPLLDAGVKFYASLGNHDSPNQRSYELFNMNGANYYTYKQGDIRFFALDSTYLDPKQLAWLETELRNAGSDWKICYFHHPLYSSARYHGPSTDLRLLLEPLFIKYGVNVVFSGHEHVYERIKPQHGIYYFTEGASGELRKGDLQVTAIQAKGFDADNTFMLIEIAGDQMYFEVISRAGQSVDSGMIQRQVPSRTNSSANQPPQKAR